MGKDVLRGFVSVRAYFRLFTHSMMLPVLESGEETLVGGQAVMEGVMMRAPHSYCVAVRRANGEMVTEEMPLARMSEQYKIFRYPVFRGVGTLYQAMKLGIKALQFSTNAAMKDLPAGSGQRRQGEGTAEGTARVGHGREPDPDRWVRSCFCTSFCRCTWPPGWGSCIRLLSGRVASNLADGVIRIGIFLFFMVLISRMKDIRRVFEYHGAEHKVVFNFESGKPVTVENAQSFTTFHPRCGTSFLMRGDDCLAGRFIPLCRSMVFCPSWRFALALLPVVVGVSYELIRFAARSAADPSGDSDRARPVAAAHHHQAAVR